jgi:hypothetical protein
MYKNMPPLATLTYLTYLTTKRRGSTLFKQHALQYGTINTL